MQEVKKLLVGQLDMHWHVNDWFASLDQALDGCTATEAAWTGSGTTNSIWQIVNHLIFWNEDVIHRIQGTTNPYKFETNEATFGEPGDAEDETGWAKTVKRLNEVMDNFKTVIEDLDDERLKEPYAANRSSVEQLLSHIMMHGSYHLGQIAVLRKLQATWAGVDWS